MSILLDLVCLIIIIHIHKELLRNILIIKVAPHNILIIKDVRHPVQPVLRYQLYHYTLLSQWLQVQQEQKAQLALKE